MKQAINQFCPNSGKPVAEDSLTQYRGLLVGFCNPDCRDDFARNMAGNPKAITYFDTVIKENKLLAE